MVRGDVRLSGSSNVTGDLSNCAGVGAFADVYKGANVVVTNQKGKPLAAGTITDGLGTNYFKEVLDECAFRIRVLNVPRAKSYFFVLGRHADRLSDLYAVGIKQLLPDADHIQVHEDRRAVAFAHSHGGRVQRVVHRMGAPWFVVARQVDAQRRRDIHAGKARLKRLDHHITTSPSKMTLCTFIQWSTSTTSAR
jgi:hypothetical protein